jgi:hypothetical protein
MRTITRFLALGLTLSLGFLPASALAQKGTGAATGVGRLADKPEMVTLSGRLVEIRTGPCEATTGRATAGTHLILETKGKQTLNVHLGPADAVADHVSKLKVGKNVEVEAFRTDSLKDAQYIARTITSGNTTITLRDDNTLRPDWAPGNARMTAGRGPGRVMGMGMGNGRGPGMGNGRGQGMGPGRGPGMGNGRGMGRGPGMGRGNGFGAGGGGCGGCPRGIR